MADTPNPEHHPTVKALDVSIAGIENAKTYAAGYEQTIFSLYSQLILTSLILLSHFFTAPTWGSTSLLPN